MNNFICLFNQQYTRLLKHLKIALILILSASICSCRLNNDSNNAVPPVPNYDIDNILECLDILGRIRYTGIDNSNTVILSAMLDNSTWQTLIEQYNSIQYSADDNYKASDFIDNSDDNYTIFSYFLCDDGSLRVGYQTATNEFFIYGYVNSDSHIHIANIEKLICRL